MSSISNYPKEEKKEHVIKNGVYALPKDLEVGFRFAIKNLLSYILAMLGIILVTAALLIIILFLIFIPLIFVVGLSIFVDLVVAFAIQIDALSGILLLSMLLIIISPILGPFFIAFGAAYGMAREIVENDGTTAEGAFTWYRKKALSFVGGGMIHFGISIAPFLIAIIGILTPPSYLPSEESLALILPLGIFWIILTNGMLSLTFPGIIDGLSAQKAARRSVRLCCRSPGRVLGAWVFFVALIGVPLLMTIDSQIFRLLRVIPTEYLGIIMPGIVLLTVFFLFPVMSIVFTRIYMILSAQDENLYHYGEIGQPPDIAGVD
ncbi:MAG: hypothetical protein BV458_10860 [Thermoplasmata archaeon M9B2D]|nr:MAG: hypothetical protein BV458_10860 [Thermoplasmata archaeon M9B2D]